MNKCEINQTFFLLLFTRSEIKISTFDTHKSRQYADSYMQACPIWPETLMVDSYCRLFIVEYYLLSTLYCQLLLSTIHCRLIFHWRLLLSISIVDPLLSTIHCRLIFYCRFLLSILIVDPLLSTIYCWVVVSNSKPTVAGSLHIVMATINARQ